MPETTEHIHVLNSIADFFRVYGLGEPADNDIMRLQDQPFHNYAIRHSNCVEKIWEQTAIFVLRKTVCFNMKGCVFLLLIVICLLVPVGVSQACGSKHVPVKREVKHVAAHKKACCARHRNHKPGDSNKKCSHSCNESGCDCAHSLPVFALKVQPIGLIQKTVAAVDNSPSWFFQETSPKPVYLSLWMPPNIGC